MVCKVDGNLQLDSRDWSMYSSLLKRNGEIWQKPNLDLISLIKVEIGVGNEGESGKNKLWGGEWGFLREYISRAQNSLDLCIPYFDFEM